MPMGRLWKETQFQASPPERSHDLRDKLNQPGRSAKGHHSRPAKIQTPWKDAARKPVALGSIGSVGMLLGENQWFGTSVRGPQPPVGTAVRVRPSSQG